MGTWCRALVVTVVLVTGGAACSGDDHGSADDDAPAEASTGSVDVVSQNLLHGIACPENSDDCDLPDRVALFVDQLVEADCPQLVSIQEGNQRTVELLRDELPEACDGAYEIVGDEDDGLDREVVLTTETVLGWRRERLAGPLRTALWVRTATDVGVVDLISTHLASGSDDRPCDETTCAPPCDAATDATLQQCQARQVAALAEEVATDDSVVLVVGDLNAAADEPTLAHLLDAGFVDTHLAAGNAECDPATGEQCTSGRVDDEVEALRDPSSRQSSRIDYVLLGGPRDCEAVAPTGLFAAEPADPAAVDGVVFASDHTGVRATVECPTTDAQRDEAATATVPDDTTTTAAEGTADPEVVAAITTSFETLFGGEVSDPEAKLAVLEDADLLREAFLEAYELQREIAPQIRVRIDEVALVDPTHADVTYSLLLDGAPVLDHLPGGAVLVDDTWLVTRRTYCDVATQGVDEIPPPCA